jgi:hypothetical protein
MKLNKEALDKFIQEEIYNLIEDYYYISDATYDDGAVAEDVEFWDDALGRG